MGHIGTYLYVIRGLADGLDVRGEVGLREREESRMTARFGA